MKSNEVFRGAESDRYFMDKCEAQAIPGLKSESSPQRRRPVIGDPETWGTHFRALFRSLRYGPPVGLDHNQAAARVSRDFFFAARTGFFSVMERRKPTVLRTATNVLRVGLPFGESAR